MKTFILALVLTLSTVSVFGQTIAQENEKTSYIANSITVALGGEIISIRTTEPRVVYTIQLPEYYTAALMKLKIRNWIIQNTDVSILARWVYDESQNTLVMAIRVKGRYRLVLVYMLDYNEIRIASY